MRQACSHLKRTRAVYDRLSPVNPSPPFLIDPPCGVKLGDDIFFSLSLEVSHHPFNQNQATLLINNLVLLHKRNELSKSKAIANVVSTKYCI